MPLSTPARLRTVWWTLHRWIGICLCVLLVPIAISGALLVWKDQLDALIHPARYAVTGPQIAQPLSSYIASTQTAQGRLPCACPKTRAGRCRCRRAPLHAAKADRMAS